MNSWVLILLVLSNAVEKCYTDSDCQTLNICVNEVCKHKPLFPIAPTEYVGLFVMILVSIIANAGGIGGSSMTISLMLLMHNFDAHTCVALTQVFIFAGSFTATLLKIRDRHPTRDRPLVYYDILMQIVSPILLGVSIGVMINPAFPSWLLLAALCLVVVLLLRDVLKRSINLYKKERSSKNPPEIIQAPEQLPPADEDCCNNESVVVYKEITKIGSDKIAVNRNDSSSSESEKDNERDGEEVEQEYPNRLGNENNIPGSIPESSGLPEKIDHPEEIGNPEDIDPPENIDPVLLRKITTIYNEEKKIISWFHLLYFLLLFVITIVFSLLRGSSAYKSIVGITSCTSDYFGVTVSYFIIMTIFSILSSIYLVRKTYVCENTNYPYDEGDIKWTYKKCFYVFICSVLAGILFGLLGMGGGSIIGPLLMYLGVRPEVATISSLFTISISSGAASTQYFISGVIDVSYLVWFFLLSIFGSLVGILVLRKIATKYQRVSLLVFCLFLILFASLFIIPTTGIMNAVKQSKQGTFQLGFKKIC